jgi:DNA ligase-1
MPLPAGFKPLLAATLDRLEDAPLPALVSVKVDGFRCLIVDGRPVSRDLKPIANEFVRKALTGLPHGLDGELVTLTDGRIDDFNTIQSKLNSEDGEPRWRFYVFDYFASQLPYAERMGIAECICNMEFEEAEALRFLGQHLVDGLTSLKDFERETVEDEKWEGVCLRSLIGPYKFGRSTLKEATLLKFKRWQDDEAEIIGFKEEMANRNEATKSALGRTERSSSKAGKVPKGTLGALVVRWVPEGSAKAVQFRLSSGLTREQRAAMWASRADLMGKKVNFSFLGVCSKGAPRHPKFRGVRYDI